MQSARGEDEQARGKWRSLSPTLLHALPPFSAQSCYEALRVVSCFPKSSGLGRCCKVRPFALSTLSGYTGGASPDPRRSSRSRHRPTVIMISVPSRPRPSVHGITKPVRRLGCHAWIDGQQGASRPTGGYRNERSCGAPRYVASADIEIRRTAWWVELHEVLEVVRGEPYRAHLPRSFVWPTDAPAGCASSPGRGKREREGKCGGSSFKSALLRSRGARAK